MEGERQHHHNNDLERWRFRDSGGFLSSDHNNILFPKGFPAAAGNYIRPPPSSFTHLNNNQFILPYDNKPVFSTPSYLEEWGDKFRINPNSLRVSNDALFQVNPYPARDPGFSLNPTPRSVYNDDLETMFNRMSLLSSGGNDRFRTFPCGNMRKGFGLAGNPNTNSSSSSSNNNRSTRFVGGGFVSPPHPPPPRNTSSSGSGRGERCYKFTSVEEVRGKIVAVTKEQQSCRVLQQKLGEGRPEDVEMIFSEVKDHVCELMVDQSGNYLVQKLFQACNTQQMTQLLLEVVKDGCRLLAICLDMHGTRAMQTMLRHLTTADQRGLVVGALRHVTVTLTKSVNGHHVIQHCIKFFSNEEKKQILNVVANNCLSIATDKSGCCVLQHCVENADVQSRERLVAEIIVNSLVLSEHPYGNYVVQNIVGLKNPQCTGEIVNQLAGSFVGLSMDKYGSNVVEKCLKESEERQANRIIQEIIYSPHFLMVLQDPFGNYVVQSALSISKGGLLHEMVDIINMHYTSLQSHPHGKRVLAKTRGNKLRL
ncbi:hypothetical protein DM860_015247 [Cuscuta australis]|uniref:PUM-HD domain-containing protein n=1 Tax=Cuscuta australis TaxID=267555 RepID=A0A328D0C2_9ASTE|nr:hypothetical protein DM860_015247 [Cuscuta australis]